MYSIGFAEIGDEQKSWLYFNRTYQKFTHQPFLVWLDTESEQLIDDNVAQYLPGAAGYLQMFLFGFAGLRLHMDSLRLKANMPMPPNTNHFYLHRIKYLDCELSFNFTKTSIQIAANRMDRNLTLTSSFDATFSQQLIGIRNFPFPLLII